MGKPRGASKQDLKGLEEMKEFCEEEISCRRKLFSVVFGDASRTGSDGKGKSNNGNGSGSKPSKCLSTAASFRPCEDMCDNCDAKRGKPRRGREDLDDIESRSTRLSRKSAKVSTLAKQNRPKFQTAKEMKARELVETGGKAGTLLFTDTTDCAIATTIDLCDGDSDVKFVHDVDAEEDDHLFDDECMSSGDIDEIYNEWG